MCIGYNRNHIYRIIGKRFFCGMSSMFSKKPVIGVLTKIDLCYNPTWIENGREILKFAGAEEILEVGFEDEECIRTLRERIEYERN